jgi:hypothetical protein
MAGEYVDHKAMDTVTYASVAALPCSVVQRTERPRVPEVEFIPLELSYLSSWWLGLFQFTGPCNDL